MTESLDLGFTLEEEAAVLKENLWVFTPPLSLSTLSPLSLVKGLPRVGRLLPHLVLVLVDRRHGRGLLPSSGGSGWQHCTGSRSGGRSLPSHSSIVGRRGLRATE